MQPPRGEQLVGTLRRKKEKHNKFEDAWKQKVLCCLEGSLLSMKTMNGSRLHTEERLDITQWSVEATVTGNENEKSKFFLTRAQQQIKLKADSIAEADLWVKTLKAASRRRIEAPSSVNPKDLVTMSMSFKHSPSPPFDADTTRLGPASSPPANPLADIKTIYRTNSGSVVTRPNTGSFSEHGAQYPSRSQNSLSFSGETHPAGTSKRSPPPPRPCRHRILYGRVIVRLAGRRKRPAAASGARRHSAAPRLLRRRRRRRQRRGRRSPCHAPLLQSVGRR